MASVSASASASAFASATASASSTGEITSKSTEASFWSHVNVKSKLSDKKGGNVKFQCKFRYNTYIGSLSRIKTHLLKIPGNGVKVCMKIDNATFRQLQKEMAEEEEIKARARPHPFALPRAKTRGASSLSGTTGSGPFRVEALTPFDQRKRKASIKSPLEKLANNERVEQLNTKIARMFYSAGLPFHLARNPYFVSSFTMAANSNVVGYVPPGYNMLRTTLLLKERATIESHLMPTKMKWVENGVSLVSDGWTDPQRNPIINFMATSESGLMFLEAVNCEGGSNGKDVIAKLMIDQIKVIGAANVVQVITDNAHVCRAVGLLVENEYPHIYWTPCVVYTLNLALKEICSPKDTTSNVETYGECHWINEIAYDAFAMKKFICNHSLNNAIYNQNVHLKLLSIAPTRFASVVVMLRRMLSIKRGLTLVVVSDKWDTFKDGDRVKAAFFKVRVLDDLWWDQIKYIVDFTEPIYEMLRVADTDKPRLHLIYDMWDTMIEKIKVVIYRHEKKQDFEESTFYDMIHRILESRWNKSNTPLHCLAHSLNPRYYIEEWLSVGRVAPYNDIEISTERNKCFRCYFPNGDNRRQVMVEYAKFSSLREEFGEFDSISDRSKMDPSIWWLVHGTSTLMLKSIAIKLLGQPASSSCCERNWSIYSFIHSIRRNKITPKRAEDLVYVHTNLCLLSRKTNQYHDKGETRMWDIGGDDFESLDGAGILEIANLSLDEPELEGVVFSDEQVVEEMNED